MNTRMHTTLCIRRSEHVRLPAVVSAVGSSRLFVRQVCSSWQINQDQTDAAELLSSELFSNAIVASEFIEPCSGRDSLHSDVKLIGMRLLDLGHSMVIAVRDTSPEPPKLVEPLPDAVHGRGLQLVDALSVRWGHYYARMGGKVVWCQLALNAGVSGVDAGDDSVAFQRVVEALQAYPWDEHAGL